MEIPKEVKKLIHKIAELWHTDPENLTMNVCDTEHVIYDVLTLLGFYRDEVSYDIVAEGNAVVIRMFDVIGNDWATIYYFHDGEPKCILLTPDP